MASRLLDRCRGLPVPVHGVFRPGRALSSSVAPPATAPPDGGYTKGAVMPINEREATAFVANQPVWLVDKVPGARSAFDKIEPARANLGETRAAAAAAKASVETLEDDLAPFDDIQAAKRAARDAYAAEALAAQAAKAAVVDAAQVIIDTPHDDVRRIAAAKAVELQEALIPAWMEVKRLLRERRQAERVLGLRPLYLTDRNPDREFKASEDAVLSFAIGTARDIAAGGEIPGMFAPGYPKVAVENDFLTVRGNRMYDSPTSDTDTDTSFDRKGADRAARIRRERSGVVQLDSRTLTTRSR